MVLPIKIRNLSTNLHETSSVAPKSFPRQKKKRGRMRSQICTNRLYSLIFPFVFCDIRENQYSKA